MQAISRRRIFEMFGTALVALGAILASIPASSLAGEADAGLNILFDDDRVTVEAENARLDRILDIIATRAKFTVERTGSRYAPSLVSGSRTGTLNDVLRWLLWKQNYVIFYKHITDEDTIPHVQPYQVLLMNPPSRGPDSPQNSVETTRSGGSRIPVAGHATNDMRTSDGLGGGVRGSAAAEGAAGIAQIKDGSAAGGGVPTRIPEKLSASGNRLSNLVIDPSDVDIVRTVDLAGDAPLATHVTAHKSAGPSLQRTDQGTWVPWDGHEDSLIDNRFTPANGGLTFDVIKGDLSDQFFPMTFTIAYRTESGLKFGSFQVMPDQRIPM